MPGSRALYAMRPENGSDLVYSVRDSTRLLGEGTPKFWTYIFKSGLLSDM